MSARKEPARLAGRKRAQGGLPQHKGGGPFTVKIPLAQAAAIGTWSGGTMPPPLLLVRRDHACAPWTCEFLSPIDAAMRILEGRA
jgi:hypothetical protein